MKTLEYNGIEIREVDGRPYLTDQWKAAGSPPNLRPAEWLRQERTQRLARQIAAELGHPANMGGDHISFLVETRRGANGGTIAEFKLALAYAADLSPAFHSWMLDVAAERLQQIPAPRPVADSSLDESRLVSIVTKTVLAVLDERAANDGMFGSARGRRVSSALTDLAKRQAILDAVGDEPPKWRRYARIFLTEVRDNAALPMCGAWAVMPLQRFAKTMGAVEAIRKRVDSGEKLRELQSPKRQLGLGLSLVIDNGSKGAN
jgi:hypothetical protein